MQYKDETERALDIYRKYQEFFKEAAFEQLKFQKWLNNRVQRHRASGNEKLIHSDQKITAVLGGITHILQALSEQMGSTEYLARNVESYKTALRELQTNPSLLRAFLSQFVLNKIPSKDKSGLSGQEDFFRDLTKLTGIPYAKNIKIAEYIVQNEETIQEAAAAWYKSQGPEAVNTYRNRDYLTSYLKQAEKKGLYLNKATVDKLRSLDLTQTTQSFKENLFNTVEQSQKKIPPKSEQTQVGELKKRTYDEIPVFKTPTSDKATETLPAVKKGSTYGGIPVKKGKEELEQEPRTTTKKSSYGDLPVHEGTKQTKERPEAAAKESAYGVVTPVKKGKEELKQEPETTTKKSLYGGLPIHEGTKQTKEGHQAITKESAYGVVTPIKKGKEELKQEPETTTKKSLYGGLPIYTGKDSQKKQETKKIEREVAKLCEKLNATTSSLPEEQGEKTAKHLLTKTVMAIRWKQTESPSYLSDVKQELITLYDDIMSKQSVISAKVFSPVMAFINESLLAINNLEAPVKPNHYTGPKKEFLEKLIKGLKHTPKNDQCIPQLYKIIDLVKNTDKFDEHNLGPLKKELMTLQKMSKGYLKPKTEIQNTAESILKAIENLELSEYKQYKK